MKRLVTAVNSSGESYLSEASEISFESGPEGLPICVVFATEESPPPRRPVGRGQYLDVGVAAGLARWFIVEWQPDQRFAMHQTDSVDFNLLISGGCELILDDGAHILSAGDCVVVTGVDHAWHAGPTGCRMSSLVIGTPRRDDSI